MKAMNRYNRALDYTVLALNELRKGNSTLAARLLAKAVEQKDVRQAIATIEASNRHAFSVQAKQVQAAKTRLKADEVCEDDDMQEAAVEDEDLSQDFSEDPLNEIESDTDEDPEEFVEEYEQDETEQQDSPAQAMAKVLSKMVRKSRK